MVVISNRERYNRRLALRLLLIQCVVVLFLSGLTLLFWDKSQALSALMGASIALLGNLYYSWRALRPLTAQALSKLASNFYRAVFGKYLIVLVLFALSFNFITLFKVPQNALFMILAFVVTQLVVNLAPLFDEQAKVGVGKS